MATPTELPKSYDPKSIEAEIDHLWNKNRAFHAEPTDPGDPYCIVIPPPNVTAALHLGHALNNTLQDILIRVHRMRGNNTVWMPGTDHAGIATQTVVERRVLKEQGKRRTDFQRDEFVAIIQKWKDEYEAVIIGQLKAMGCSCDWERTAFTMDEPRARAVREAFFQLFKDGLIYRGKRLVNWDPATQTALADDEVEMEEVDGHFYYLKYPIVGDGGSEVGGRGSENSGRPPTHDSRPTTYVTVATTRPETMLGDTAVGINPRDPRAASLRGKKVRLPIVNRIIPIVEDDYVVMADPNSDDPKAKYATGFLKVTPAHDQNDYELGQRHKLEIINVMAPDGTISDKHGWSDRGDADFLIGLDRYEARKALVEWFRQNKLLEDVKPYRHSVGHSYRSHVPIEPYLSDQWYCKVTDDRLAGAALRAIAPDQLSSPSPGTPGEGRGEGQTEPSPALTPTFSRSTGRGSKTLRFYPARYAKTFQSWHENLRDWCISRQLWWGHRIPVWRKRITITPDNRSELLGQLDLEFLDAGDPVPGYMLGPNYANVPEVATAVFQHVETGEIFRLEKDGSGAPNYSMPWITPARSGEFDVFVCAKQFPLMEERLASHGFTQDPDVLDTWFSSGLWPMSTLGWPGDPAAEAASPDSQSAIRNPQSALNVWNPGAVLTTAREIITLWVSRMVMFNLYFLNRLPFNDVYIHAMIQDGEGRKMSKSLGNGVDPLDIIHSHGTDAMRFTLASMATNTQDVRVPVEKDPTSGKNTSPRFDLGRNFCNKLWNAARFVMMQLEQSGPATKFDETKLSMADRWIVSRFNRTVAECNDALANYRFDQYAKACYDYFWRDFCDWYVEASKPAMRNPERAARTAQILAATLDGSLRLLHPLVPFVTEQIWQRLNAVRTDRNLEGRIDSKPSELLIRAAWPAQGDFSQAAEHIWPRIQEIVIAIRNVRNDYKVDPKKPVTVSIKSPAESARQIESHRAEIEILATCRVTNVGAEISAPTDSTKTSASGCEIYLEGLVDKAAEAQRNTKRVDELNKLVAQLKGRLSNEGYIAKAPQKLVDQTKQQLTDAEAELAKLG